MTQKKRASAPGSRPTIPVMQSLFSKESARAAREHFVSEPFAGPFSDKRRKQSVDRFRDRFGQLARAVEAEQDRRKCEPIHLDNSPNSNRRRARRVDRCEERSL